MYSVVVIVCFSSLLCFRLSYFRLCYLYFQFCLESACLHIELLMLVFQYFNIWKKMVYFGNEKNNKENRKIRIWRKTKKPYLSVNLNDEISNIIHTDKTEAPSLSTTVTVIILDQYIYTYMHRPLRIILYSLYV